MTIIALTVFGANFTADAVATIGGVEYPTVDVSTRELLVQVDTATLPPGGSLPLVVTCGGLTTPPYPVPVGASGPGAPTIGSFSPTTLTAGTGTVTLTLTGTNYIAPMTGSVDGNDTPVTIISDTSATMDVDTDLLAAGNAVVSVTAAGGTRTRNIVVNAAPPVIVDPPLSEVVLLLHMDGTSFVDSSQYAHALAVTGTTAVSTAQSKFGGASGDFTSRTGDVRTGDTVPEFVVPMNGDFTIEFQIYNLGGNASLATAFVASTSGTLYFRDFFGPFAVVFNNAEIADSIVLATNAWSHIAIVRHSNVWRVYHNGADVTTTVQTNNFAYDFSRFCVGADHTYGRHFGGYMDEVRFVNGTACYLGDFTPPTAPFLPVQPTPPPTTDPDFANVSLLLPMNGTNGSTTFTDSSSNMLAATVNGNAQISTAQSKWGGASGLFDGSGDYLAYAPSTLFDWSGDSTIEAWIRLSSFGSSNRHMFGTTTATYDQKTSCHVTPSGQISIGRVGLSEIISAANTIAIDTWHFVQFVRTGNTSIIRVDGVEVATGGASAAWSSGADPFSIGRTWQSSGDQDWHGHIDDLRITKGVARPNVVPTAAFPDSGPPATTDPDFADVLLLLNMDGADNGTVFTDLSPYARAITSSGGPVTKTGVKKYGTASMRCGGGAVVLNVSPTITLAGDFTIETWFNADDIAADQCLLGSSAGNNQIMRLNNTGNMGTVFVYAEGYVMGGLPSDLDGILSAQFYHYALTRSGNTCRLFVNGSLVQTSTFTGPVAVDVVGAGYAGSSNPVTGNIDEVRISAVCRYIANFTPPTAAFPTS